MRHKCIDERYRTAVCPRNCPRSKAGRTPDLNPAEKSGFSELLRRPWRVFHPEKFRDEAILDLQRCRKASRLYLHLREYILKLARSSLIIE